MDRFALDLETIPTVSDPAFDEPEHWTIFGIGLGYTPSDSSKQNVEVLFRDDSSTQSELDLIINMIDWIADRYDPSHSTFLLTYNGTSYDFPVLRHRSSELRREYPTSNVSERLSLLLNSVEHRDLITQLCTLASAVE